MKKFFGKKRTLALAVVAVLAVAGAAIAYFSSTGSGTGSASVGSSSAFTVSVSAATGGPLLPGSGTQNLAYTVTNPSSGNQNLNGTTAAVAADSNGDIKQGGTAVAGCKASWFTVTNHSPAAQNLNGGGSANGSVDVIMTDSGTNQDSCQAASPDITVSAS